MTSLWQDIRYAVRMMAKNPGFTAVALIVLALGLGANGAMFSVVYHVMLRPLPYRDPDQLVRVVIRWRDGIGPNLVPVQGQAMFERMRSFESVAMTFPATGCNLVGGSSPEYVLDGKVSSSFFHTLGVNPIIGRDFVVADATHGGGSVAIISYAAWQRYFGGDSGVIGKQVQCNGQSLSVIGVLPANFRFMNPAQIWVPAPLSDYLKGGGGMNHTVFARLRPGVTRENAQQELDTVFAQLKAEHPGFWWTTGKRSRGMAVMNFQAMETSDARQPLLILFGAVGLVLLIACANLAGLLLARSAARAHEIAVRMAVGASRRRIAAQLLTETLLLNLAGGALGLGLAFWIIGGMRAILPTQTSWFSTVRLDPSSLSLNVPVVLFMLAVSLLSGLISGSIPALVAGRRAPQSRLASGERIGGFSRAQHRSRKVLVVGEVAVSLALLVGATLLIHSFMVLQQQQLGFNPRDLQVAQLSLASKNFATTDAVWQFQQKTIEAVRRIPGVVDAASASSAPLASGLNLGSLYTNGKECPGGSLDYRAISPSFFGVTQTPVLRGRAFAESDSAQSAHVVIINESLARACFGSSDPVGQSVHMYESSAKGEGAEVVGVVADIKDYAVGLPAPPIAYVPQAQIANDINQTLYQAFGLLSAIMVRTSQAQDLSVPLTRAVQAVDPQQPVASVGPMSQLISESVALNRLLMVLMGAFAALAVLLTAVGLYGLLAYYVTQRTREIGIRMALGAAQDDVLRLIVREGMTLIAIGLAFGLAGAFSATTLLKTLVFGVKPTDPIAFTAALLLLLLVGLIATAVPARRASQVDPMLALRQQ